ncbi:aldehyde dehydrogenase family protein [Caballeronia sp. LZ002]|nr:aldehyde dehydrogenase family protein [Caballeronia sp. LZ002]MDR5852758.1 aldehyde dehydrogenase family protein [Caballeronia sp. LZ003]
MQGSGVNQAETFLGKTHQLMIGGERVDALSGGTFEVVDPATENVIAEVARAGAEDVDRAVRVAQETFTGKHWRTLNGATRTRLLLRYADIIERHADELAVLETRNNGMPIGSARRTVALSVDWLRHFAGAVTRIHGQSFDQAALSTRYSEIHSYTRREPVGVVGLITPWNGPIGVFMTKVAPALAAGCTVVLKPSEITPLTALRLGELALEAGIPPGVLNIVPGYGAEAGQAIADHAVIRRVSFTGSTLVGKQLVHASAGNLKRLTLELGGKSPLVIFDDADLDRAVPAAAMAIAANTGQICFAGSRLFVQKKVFDRVVAGIGEVMSTYKLGNGMDPATVLGPVVSQKQRGRVLDYIARGCEEGAEIAFSGPATDGPGYFVPPTVFVGTRPGMKIVREEIFGPVLVASPFEDINQVALSANDTTYGLGAGIYTTDLRNAHRLAARIESGNVWVNCYGIMDAAMPFGGLKQSGIGRVLGDEGLGAFLETKSVFVNLE